MNEFCIFFKEFLNDVDFVLENIEKSNASDAEKRFIAISQTQNILNSYLKNDILPYTTYIFLSYNDGKFSYWFDEYTEKLLSEKCGEEI